MDIEFEWFDLKFENRRRFEGWGYFWYLILEKIEADGRENISLQLKFTEVIGSVEW